MNKFIYISIIRCALIFFLLLLAIEISGQTYESLTNNSTTTATTESTLNIAPPSPEAFFKTRYGDLASNEFRGVPLVNIPLFRLDNKGVTLPVELRYGRAGVKVNDLPNSVGMNWMLDAGGIITRTIYDIVDENSSHRILLNNNELGALNSPSYFATLRDYAVDNLQQYDHEIDIFNYTIPGHSGSFYLDANLNPVLLTQDNDLTIQKIGDFKISHQLLITTYDGKKYLFGGADACEETWVRLDANHSGITGFYLTSIQDGMGNRINFSYSNTPQQVISLGKDEFGFLSSEEKGYFDLEGNYLEAHGLPDHLLYKHIILKNKKNLSTIFYNQERVKFNFSKDSNYDFDKLNSIEWLHSDQLIRKIDFEYFSNNHRFFLTAVRKNTQGYPTETYRLQYDDPETLPDRDSNSIDFLGYFNGKNNYRLLPNLNLFGAGLDLFNLNNTYADRRPDFNYAKKGTLNSITYPTGGKTVFEYEAVHTKQPMIQEKILTVGNASSIYFPVPDESLYLPLSYNSGTTFNAGDISGKAKISLKIHSDADPNLAQKAMAVIKIINIETGSAVYTKKINVPKLSQNASIDEEIALEPQKDYKAIFSIENNICNQCSSVATINLLNGWEEKEDCNIRLGKQYDIAGNDTINIKKYFYTPLLDVHTASKLSEPFIPNFKSYSYNQVLAMGLSIIGGGMLSVYSYNTYLNSDLQNSKIINLDSDTGEESSYNIFDPVFPTVSISYGGDNFEKGGEEKVFNLFADIRNNYTFKNPSIIGMNNLNNDYSNTTFLELISNNLENSKFYRYLPLQNLNGRLLSARIYTKKNGQLYLKKETTNTYDSPRTGNISSIVGTKVYEYNYLSPSWDTPSYLNNLYIGAFQLPSFSSFLTSTMTKEFLDDVPAGTTDDSSFKKITTTTNYYYENPSKQLSKSKSTISGTSYETIYRYAQEKGNQKLIDANMVGVPLEVEARKDGKTISRTETRYDDPASLLPTSSISYDISTVTPKTQVKYTAYDDRGNLLEYRDAQGVPTTIIWGYNKALPIAKIEGLPYGSATNLYATIISASDADDLAAPGSDESALLSALESFRKSPALAGYQVTTYTHDPLVGVRSITPPSGIRENYTYDAAGRLQKVTDMAGKLLKEYQYNYKQ